MLRIASAADAIAAGRAGLWLLGRRASAAAKRRTPFPQRVYRTLTARACALIVPWRCAEYPGNAAVIAALCGVARDTAGGWLRGKAMPLSQRERLASYLEARASVYEAMAAELRASVIDRKSGRGIRSDIAVRQAGAVTIGDLTDGAKPGPRVLGFAETGAPQVTAKNLTTAATSIPEASPPPPSKIFGTDTPRQAKRKAKPQVKKSAPANPQQNAVGQGSP